MAYNPKNPGWGITGYTSRALAGRTEKEMRAEYTRLKSMLRKRGKAIARSAYGPDHPMAKRLLNLPSSKGLTTGQLKKALKEAGKLSQQKTSSVTGLDAAYNNTFKKIYGKEAKGRFSRTSKKTKKAKSQAEKNRQDLRNFGLFMEAYRAKMGEKKNSQGSPEAQALYEELKTAGVNPNRVRAHIDKWLDLYHSAQEKGKYLEDYMVKTKNGAVSTSAAAWREAMGLGAKKSTKSKKSKKSTKSKKSKKSTKSKKSKKSKR